MNDANKNNINQIMKYLSNYKIIYEFNSKNRTINENIILNIKTQRGYNISDIRSSKEYWEKRYANGGNSGPGSYNELAKFKASVINNFVNKNHINSVIEWGSGDCNQLKLANYKNYIGYDVSISAVNICKKKFYNDSSKSFYHLSDNFINDKKADLSLSLDVIFHLIEDNIFDLYMYNLFNSSNKYIIIYSSNSDNRKSGKFVKHRKFTVWIDKHMSKNWRLKEYIPNKYPMESKFKGAKSYSNFYIYEKIIQ